MRGAAAWFADILNQGSTLDPDLIFMTGFINVADLRGLLDPPLDRTPMLLYMHENQLTYPLSPEEEFDFHFGFTNIISALAADRVVFNSAWHRDLFLDALPSYLNRMPEAVPKEVAPRLEGRSDVLGVGLDRAPLPSDHFPQYRGGEVRTRGRPRLAAKRSASHPLESSLGIRQASRPVRPRGDPVAGAGTGFRRGLAGRAPRTGDGLRPSAGAVERPVSGLRSPA